MSLVPGVLAALGGAFCYGAAPAVQAVAARREITAHGAGVRLTLRLAGRPLWLLGFASEILGFGLEAYAFSQAPTTLVAPLLTCDLVVFVLLAAVLIGVRPAGRGLVGLAAIGAGLTAVGVSFGGSGELGDPAGDAELWSFAAVSVVVAGVAALVGGRTVDRSPLRAAAVFATASGIAYGFGTLSTRQVGRTISAGAPWRLLATPTPYVLAVCSIIAIATMQRGLQTGPLITYPIVSVGSSLLPVLLGAAVLNDPVPSGAARIAFVAGLVAVVGGVLLLARDRARHEGAEGSEEAVSPPAAPGGSA